MPHVVAASATKPRRQLVGAACQREWAQALSKLRCAEAAEARPVVAEAFPACDLPGAPQLLLLGQAGPPFPAEHVYRFWGASRRQDRSPCP